MRPYISLTFTFFLLITTLQANEYYLLPEHKSDLIHTLKRKIERAHRLTIITAELESQTLSRSIEKLLKKEHHFTLITPSISAAAYYAKYKNSKVYLPPAQRPLKHFNINILIIDKSDICISSLPFKEQLLRQSQGTVSCTTTKEEVDFGVELIKKYQQRFERYN